MLTNYLIYDQYVDLFFSDDTTHRVYATNRSGVVIKRPKIHPIGKFFIDHKGIVLGSLLDGTEIVLHNHIEYNRAIVDTIEGFEKGVQSQVEHKYCSNDITTQIQIALNNIIEGKQYHKINNNCQVFVNNACTNTSKSDDTFRIIGGVAVGAILLVGLGMFFSKRQKT